jgi:uncharacterized protein (TIGR00297 family)
LGDEAVRRCLASGRTWRADTISLVLGSILLALVFAAGVSACAAAVRALSLDGALAATIVGTAVFAGGGVSWSLLLLAFFATSSALSRLPQSRKYRAVTAKSGPRDAAQILANGAIPAALAALNGLHPSPLWLIPFAGSLAAATADTWATEIGRWSRAVPRSIVTGQPVLPGTSGGVTALGTMASACGASLIAVCAGAIAGASLPRIAAIALGGVLGSVVDSLLGATVQETRLCPHCLEITEQKVHRPCATPTVHSAGRAGVTNDTVNFLATLAGALIAVVSALLLQVML